MMVWVQPSPCHPSMQSFLEGQSEVIVPLIASWVAGHGSCGFLKEQRTIYLSFHSKPRHTNSKSIPLKNNTSLKNVFYERANCVNIQSNIHLSRFEGYFTRSTHRQPVSRPGCSMAGTSPSAASLGRSMAASPSATVTCTHLAGSRRNASNTQTLIR